MFFWGIGVVPEVDMKACINNRKQEWEMGGELNSSIQHVIRTGAGSTKTTERLLGVQEVNSAANGPKYLCPEGKQQHWSSASWVLTFHQVSSTLLLPSWPGESRGCGVEIPLQHHRKAGTGKSHPSSSSIIIIIFVVRQNWTVTLLLPGKLGQSVLTGREMG